MNDLPNPENLGEYELVGWYMRVYAQYQKTSKHITNQITGNTDKDQYLDRVAAAFEQPLEQWLNHADEHLPEWFNVVELLKY